MARHLMRVKEGFSTDIDGVPTTYGAGQIVQSDDPGVKIAPVQFEEVEETVSRPDVEQATAEPGEKRGAGATKTTGTKKSGR